MALKEEQKKVSSDPFADLDFGDVDAKTKQQIAPGSYTAAIKGFAVDYAKKKGYKKFNIEDFWKITEFKPKHVIKVRNETKLAYFPKKGELIGLADTLINQNMSALGLAASMDVLQQGMFMDEEMTRRLNVIANIVNRQTIDYDVQYHVWILNDSAPLAFSGPGGFIFISKGLMKLLTDNREIVAVIAHEVGHIAMRHGIRDLAIEQARYSAEAAFDELETHMDAETLLISDDLELVVEQAVNACALVRDDKEEYEADEISRELLRRYKIHKKYLINALKKMSRSLGNEYPRYKNQLNLRVRKLSGAK